MNRLSTIQKTSFKEFFKNILKTDQNVDSREAGKKFGKQMSKRRISKKTPLERMHFGTFSPVKPWPWER